MHCAKSTTRDYNAVNITGQLFGSEIHRSKSWLLNTGIFILLIRQRHAVKDPFSHTCAAVVLIIPHCGLNTGQWTRELLITVYF